MDRGITPRKWYLVKREGGRVACYVFKDGVGSPLRQFVRHSPDGYECGYGGSGPADLALSILADYQQTDKPTRYQEFKWKFIAPMSRQGGNITDQEIEDFLKTDAG